ncbi:MAG: MBL fold metallo-hydrolase [Pseudomonadota bacterium]
MSDNDQKPALQAAIIPVTGFQQNCTLLWSTETMEGAVIDPGGDVDRILEAIKQSEVKVTQIVLTHGHIDHAGGAKELKAALGVDIIGPHEDDLFLLESLEATGASYGIAGAQNVVPDQWLNEGETLSMAGADWEIFHCPGHSPGSVVFFNKKARFAIVGDVLFAGSVGRTDLPRGNHEDLISSIRTKLFPLGDDVGFLCGHGPGSNIGHERQTNPFLQD